MKYIIQFVREVEPGFLGSDIVGFVEFQVIFSAKSEKEAHKKGKSIFKIWKRDYTECGNDFSYQLFKLDKFILIKEAQYKLLLKYQQKKSK